MAFFHRGRWAVLAAATLLQSILLIPRPAHADTPQAPPSKGVTITILHTNDMHGHVLPETDKSLSTTEKVGGAAWLAGFVNRERKANPGRVLLIDSGDVAQGTAISNMSRGRVMADFMNLMNYDAGTIGNHEFDWGPKSFADLISWARRPIVCANLRVHGSKDHPVGVRPYVIKKVAGVPVGITGIITAETPAIAFKKNVASFDFLEPAAVLRELIPQMRKDGARVIVVVSHSGEKEDRALAAAVPGITAIIGGHSHTALVDPVVVNGTVIVQAGKYLRYLGKLDLTVEPATGKVLGYTQKAELIPVIDSKVEPDPAVAALVKKYETELGPLMQQVVGKANADFNRKPDAGFADSSLGCIITDSLRDAGKAEVAVYNAGGIRNDLNKGTVTKGDMYAILPFDNVLMTLTLTGAQLEALLQQGAREVSSCLQVSGVTFTIGADGKVTDIKVGGNALEPSKRYTVATVDFVAEGNDGYSVMRQGADRKYGDLQRDVFEQYVRKVSPLNKVTSSRIRYLKKEAAGAK